MTLGTDILHAVKLGGSERWRPACELEQKRKSPPRPKELETALNAMYEALGNDRLTTKQWSERLGWKPELIRHRADILIKQKKIKRTAGMMPFMFFKT